ncbi:hypothetical protein FB45DRAFT_180453 [Roridomyces roridus]|uniref:Protein kinase domain-containing protein n=1 Tax=Roridomyces roridus TaxID=1738132 RepID=A0AAD7CE12_9AGAR|nr:hypothetical protein FB45DRAFT_180453 [Roridomyces roridus]
MTTLTITCRFPEDEVLSFEREDPDEPLTLRLVNQKGADAKLTVDKLVLATDGTRHTQSLVLRGRVTGPLGTMESILKLDFTGEHRDAMLKEATVYQKTKVGSLQGDVLPRFYGCFEAKVGSMVVTCLAMEYCGEPVEDLRHIAHPFRQNLLLAVRDFHKRGKTHGDLYEGNILDCHGHPVLIDLEFAEDHKCVIKMKIVTGAIRPTVEEYGCPELYELISERLGLWKTAVIRFCNQTFWKDDVTCAEHLLDNMPTGTGDEERHKLAEQAKLVFQEILKERRLTYGTEEVLPGQRRVDYLEGAHVA